MAFHFAAGIAIGLAFESRDGKLCKIDAGRMVMMMLKPLWQLKGKSS